MSNFPLHKIPDNFRDAHITPERYRQMYQRSVEDPAGFWGEQATEFLQWDQPWQTVVDYDFHEGRASWFAGGRLNVSVNCIDRHLATRADQTALLWEGDAPAQSQHITYRELH